VSPLTASPVPSTSRSSPSTRLFIRIDRVIGLPRPIDARIVGLANGRVPLCEMGDDATEPAAEDGMGIGIGPRDEEPERGMYIGEREVWFSRRRETEGDTARRLEEVGYGSKRSSSAHPQACVSNGEKPKMVTTLAFSFAGAHGR
jgi:hypothetical protein